MKAIVLCAGRGTRLEPLTLETPKPMLPVDGVPLLEWTLTHLQAQGVREVAINLHHLSRQIVEWFEDGSDLGLKIHYVYEEELLGTAGTVRSLESWVGDDESFLVVYGDILTDQPLAPLQEAHRDRRALATLLLHRRRRSNSLVDLDADGRVVGFVERPENPPPGATRSEDQWVNSGVQILNRRIFEHLARAAVEGSAHGELDLPRDVYSKILHDEYFAGVPLSGFRVAIDSLDRYEEAQEAVRDGRLAVEMLPSV